MGDEGMRRPGCLQKQEKISLKATKEQEKERMSIERERQIIYPIS